MTHGIYVPAHKKEILWLLLTVIGEGGGGSRGLGLKGSHAAWPAATDRFPPETGQTWLPPGTPHAPGQVNSV